MDTVKAARVSHTKWTATDEVGKADDGRQPYVLLVRLTVSDDQSARSK